MKHCKIKCKVITPTCIFGVNQLELRESSVKGLIRYWWRAITAWENVHKMYEKEAMLFGDSTGIKGKSPLKLKLNIHNKNVREYFLLPHKKNKKNKNEKAPFNCYMPGTTFTINLYSRENIDFYKDIVIAIMLLGGLGKRSRRGFGACVVDSIDGQKFIIDDLGKYITKLLNKICNKEIYKNEDNKVVRINKNIKIKYPVIEEIEIGRLNKYAGYDSLLTTIGNASHKYCSDALGYSYKRNRLASPIYVSAYMIDQNYIPIITTLWTNIKNPNILKAKDTRQDFKEAIL